MSEILDMCLWQNEIWKIKYSEIMEIVIVLHAVEKPLGLHTDGVWQAYFNLARKIRVQKKLYPIGLHAKMVADKREKKITDLWFHIIILMVNMSDLSSAHRSCCGSVEFGSQSWGPLFESAGSGSRALDTALYPHNCLVPRKELKAGVPWLLSYKQRAFL